MAIKLEDTYPGRTIIDGNNPFGTFKNSSPPGSLTGTPGDNAWARDMWSFLEILMSEGSMPHSGTPDDATASQRYDALVKAGRDVWPVWDSAHTYRQGVVVVLASSGSPYYSLLSTNLNHNPLSSPTYWQAFDIETYETAAKNAWPLWDSANTYVKSARTIGSDGNPYYSLQAANLNNDPVFSPTWWRLFEYTSLRSDARNVWPIWDFANIYIKGAITIASDEITYQSLQNASLNNDPVSNPAWWTPFLPSITVPATPTVRGITLLRRRIILQQTAADADLNTAAGNFEFDDGSGEARIGVFVKTINASWAQGTFQPGRAAGVALLPGTWYNYFALSNAAGSIVDFGFDISPTASNLLADANVIAAGLTKYSYQGSVLTNATNNMLPFLQNDRYFSWTPRIEDNVWNFITVNAGPHLRAISVPPGIPTRARICLIVWNVSGSDRYGYFDNPDHPSITVDINNNNFVSKFGGQGVSSEELEIFPNSSGQIRETWDSGGKAGEYTMQTVSYENLRLK